MDRIIEAAHWFEAHYGIYPNGIILGIDVLNSVILDVNFVRTSIGEISSVCGMLVEIVDYNNPDRISPILIDRSNYEL